MATDPFLRKKWERVFFTFFDINKNKSIDWNDFEMLFEKIKALRGEQSNEYKICSDSMGAVWKGLLQDVKGISMTDAPPTDVEISVTEWNNLWKQYDPKKLTIWQWEYVKYMFFLLDSSGDKRIDKEEYTEVMQIYHVPKDECEKAFDTFVKFENKSNQLYVDYGLFVKLFNAYFHSDDKNNPANYLFGPLD